MSQLKVDLGLVQKYNVAGPRYTSYPPATRFTDRITWSKLAPGRLAVFSYAHVPWIKPAQKILEQAVLPSAETKLQILKLIIEKLTANDRYVYIGMDHFARPDDELAVAQRSKTLQRNFQGYSTRGGADIYSFGMSSISSIPNAYWQNQKDLKTYYTALRKRKSAADQRLLSDRGRQDSARDDHVAHVRSGRELRGHVQEARRGFSGLLRPRAQFARRFAGRWAGRWNLAGSGRARDWETLHPEHRDALRRSFAAGERAPVLEDDLNFDS